MAGVKMAVSVESDEWKRALEQLSGKVSAIRPVLLSVGEYVLGQTLERFRKQTAPDGSRWKRVEPRYWRKKKVKKILTESSRLRESINYRVVGDRVLIGTNLRYAAIHQLGGEIDVPAQTRTAKRGTKGKNKGRFMVGTTKAKHAISSTFTIPAHKVRIKPRPFLGLPDKEREHVRDLVREYLNRSLSGGQ